jgi:hypothetical protein
MMRRPPEHHPSQRLRGASRPPAPPAKLNESGLSTLTIARCFTTEQTEKTSAATASDGSHSPAIDWLYTSAI